MFETARSYLQKSQDLQSALISLGIWAFGLGYVLLGEYIGTQPVDLVDAQRLFGSYLVIFLALLVSVFLWPAWQMRKYVALFAYVSATCFAIFLTENPFGPFFVLFIWIYLSFGTRYGQKYLRVATVVSGIGFVVVLLHFRAFETMPLEAFFLLSALLILPLYQQSLLRRLHEAKQLAERARIDAELASQAKTRFLANVSHEIRTPMNAITAMVQVLKRSPMGGQESKNLHSIQRACDHLLEIVNDVLNLSEIESGGHGGEITDFDLFRLVFDVVELYRPLAAEKGLIMIENINPATPQFVRGDSRSVRQIVINLISNAIKYTERGSVSVSLASKLGDKPTTVELLFEVADTGMGIAGIDKEAVFDRFAKGAGSQRLSAHGSTGLGLAIAKQTAEAIGGSIDFSSQEGKGSKFWFSVPLERALGSAAPQAELVPPRPAKHPSLHILLLEDDPISNYAVQLLLQQLGHTVHSAKNGLAAVELLAREQVDVIVADVHTPGLNGLDLTELVRTGKTSSDPRLPIVGLTASALPEEREQYRQVGMDVVLLKPINLDELKVIFEGIQPSS